MGELLRCVTPAWGSLVRLVLARGAVLASTYNQDRGPVNLLGPQFHAEF